MALFGSIKKFFRSTKRRLARPLARRLVRDQAVFEAVLVRLTENPEAFYQMFSQREVRRKLPAQTALLKQIAGNERTLMALVKTIPPNLQGAAIRSMTAQSVTQLRNLGESPEVLAASVLALEGAPKTQKNRIAVRGVFVESLKDQLQEHAAPVMLSVIEDDPDAIHRLIASQKISDPLLEALASQRRKLVALLVLSTVHLNEETRPSSRIRRLLVEFAREPVFRTAMQRDPSLRAALLKIVENGYESAGQPLLQVLVEAQAQAQAEQTEEQAEPPSEPTHQEAVAAAFVAAEALEQAAEERAARAREAEEQAVEAEEQAAAAEDQELEAEDQELEAEEQELEAEEQLEAEDQEPQDGDAPKAARRPPGDDQ